jgi:hypothetical protein
LRHMDVFLLFLSLMIKAVIAGLQKGYLCIAQ